MTVVELAETAYKDLETIDRLRDQKQNADDINATQKELQEVQVLAIQVCTLYQLLHNRLELVDIQQSELPKIMQKVQELRQQFADRQKIRQVQEIRHSVKAPLGKIKNKIEIRWREYAEKRSKWLLDFLEVIQNLPEIRDKAQFINKLKRRLEGFLATVPTNQAELEEFDQCLLTLQEHLSQLQNVHPDVTNFLRKVHNNQATMADVTNEVLSWCQQGNHAQVFLIRFAS
jgi:DNA repair exonuclease SbcCD ATPase subunit